MENSSPQQPAWARSIDSVRFPVRNSSTSGEHVMKLVQRQQEDIRELRESVCVLRDCLESVGVLSNKDYWNHLHKHRFLAAVRRHPCSFDTTLPDLLKFSRDLVFAILRGAGSAAVAQLCAASRVASDQARPTPREALALFPEFIYMLGGSDGAGALATAERFRPDETGSRWEVLPELLQARVSAVAGVLAGGTEVHLWGGYNGSAWLRTAERLDTTGQGSWESFLPVLPHARGGAAAVVVDGKAYIFGGYDGETALSSSQCFNPGTGSCGTWTPIPPMAQRRSGATAAAIAGKIYVCGGAVGDGLVPLRSVERFNPFSLTWQAAPPMGEARRDAAAVALSGRIFICGGFDGQRTLSAVESYDHFAGEAWQSVVAMRSCRTGLAAVSLRGKIYVCGGFDGEERLSSVECLDIEVERWDEVAPMTSRRAGAAVAIVKL